MALASASRDHSSYGPVYTDVDASIIEYCMYFWYSPREGVALARITLRRRGLARAAA